MSKCKFDKAWQGPCGKEVTNGEFCDEHAGKKCQVCGEQATNECDYAGQFVCGVPLCDNCEGWHDGTPSAWGFIGHHHRKKSDA